MNVRNGNNIQHNYNKLYNNITNSYNIITQMDNEKSTFSGAIIAITAFTIVIL